MHIEKDMSLVNIPSILSHEDKSMLHTVTWQSDAEPGHLSRRWPSAVELLWAP